MQIAGEGTSKTIKMSKQSDMHSSAGISAASSMQEEHLKRNQKDNPLQFSEKLLQCHQCRFTTYSEQEWFLHKETHVDEAPCISKETEETDPEVLRAAEVLVDITKKTLEMIKDEKK
ncbi:uncharacterized protein [Centruroides vittatus]|uniref:uncharacterized protein n=1 Tax=Centruroides vittatus TaxID=120091 RepID=UPI00350F813F